MRGTLFLLPLTILAGTVGLVYWIANGETLDPPIKVRALHQRLEHLATSVLIDDVLTEIWERQGLQPAELAPNLTLFRRLSLALHGTIPSLEEIREFEQDNREGNLSSWTFRMLRDPRFSEYFAERLARAAVGIDGGDFIVYRRDRLVDWLAEQLRERQPYDVLVRQLIAAQGLWTGQPPTNFVMAAHVEGEFDHNTLASRTVRMFLGQRMDCAQCHDHPFEDWTQDQFAGLAAHFQDLSISVVGVEDHRRDKRPTQFDSASRVAATLPFNSEWAAQAAPTNRHRLASWITHRENQRFARATVNRVWALMFGRPIHSPVDDLPDPGDHADPTLAILDLLADDFQSHGFNLHRLIQVIVKTKAFRLESIPAAATSRGSDDFQWESYPLVRLRPEQMIGAMTQATSIRTIDRNSPLVIRLIQSERTANFIREYGDLGSGELTSEPGTVSQALQRMNSGLVRELTQADAFSAPGRIVAMSANAKRCVETSYLCCLTRRPTAGELKHFTAQLEDPADDRRAVMEDLYWSLYNSAEFAWNH